MLASRLPIIIFVFALAYLHAAAGEPFEPYGFRIGGNGIQRVVDIAVDPANGDIIVAGITTSEDLPARSGAYQSPGLSKENGFVMRFNADCSALKFTVVIGGAEFDEITGVAIASTGAILITGNTTSGSGANGFPVISNAFDTESRKGEMDAFYSVISGDGRELLYSSFLGGEKPDRATDIITLNSRTIIIVGETESSKFPGIQSAMPGQGAQGFASMIITTGGGLGLDSTREIISYFLGGTSRDYITAAVRLNDSKFAVTGTTFSSDFPVTPGLPAVLKYKGKSDAFAAIFDIGQQLTPKSIWCLGGGNNEESRAIAFDSDGLLAIVGATSSGDFPTEGKSVSPRLSGKSDAFVTVCLPIGTIIYSTYLGGSDVDSATCATFSKHGELVTSGISWSNDFTWSGLTAEWLSNNYAGQSDGFISVIAPMRQQLLYSSMFGGSKSDAPAALLISEQNSIMIAGRTNSPNATFNPKFSNTTFPTGADDGFIVLHTLLPNLFSMWQTIQFPDTYVGDTYIDSAEVTATGLGIAEFRPKIINDSEGNFQLLSTEPRKLFSRETDTIIVVFAPKSAGLKNAALAFVSARGDMMRLVLPLTGIGKSEVLAVNLPLMLGNVDVGSTSPPSEIIIKNSGVSKCIVSSAAFSGGDSPAFNVSGTFPVEVAPGKTAAIPVTFSPKSRRQYLCDIRIVTNKGSVTGKIGGNGIGAAIVSSSPLLLFEPTEVGSGQIDSIILRNVGERTANFMLSIENDAENNFSIIYPDSGSITPNAEVTVKLQFNPKSESSKKAILLVAGPKFENVRIPLSGAAVPPSELSLQLAIDTLTAHIGEALKIPVRVLSASGFPPNGIRHFEAVLRYNGSILGFGDSSYSTYAIPPWRVITLTGFYSSADAYAKAPLFQAYLTAALGDTNITAVILDSLRWFGDRGERLHSNFIVRNGQVKIIDATEFPTQNAFSLKPHPIPASNMLHLDIISPISNPVLTLYSVTGTVVIRKQLGITPNESQTISLPVEQLGRGCYIAVLSAGKFATAERCYILTP